MSSIIENPQGPKSAEEISGIVALRQGSQYIQQTGGEGNFTASGGQIAGAVGLSVVGFAATALLARFGAAAEAMRRILVDRARRRKAEKHGGKLDQIPRLKGEFFWSQVKAAKGIGCDMIYVAMFDEVDEATAIFKCTNIPPTADNAKFITYEGLPGDHYLKLTGQAGRLLRNEIAAGDSPLREPECRADPRPEKKAKPNVLFIVCDDLNTHVSTSGYRHIRTPAFSPLVSEYYPAGHKFGLLKRVRL